MKKKICATASAVLLFTICDGLVSAETKKVPTDELERQLHAGLVEQGRPATSIDCPDELDKDEGAEVECTAIFYGLEQIMTVTFNGIDGDLINLHVTEEPTRVTPDGLTDVLKTYLEEQGKPAESIDCPDALDADKGAQVECAAVRNGLEYTVTATSNGADGNKVDVEYVVAEKPKRWPRDWLARQLQVFLKDRRGAPADSVDCPDELAAGEGSEVECTFVDNGLEFTATLTAKGVDVGLRTADDPSRMTRKGLEAHVRKTEAESGGRNPDDVVCPEEGLITKVGETQRCLITTGAGQFDVTVTVTSVGGGTMEMDYNIKRRE